MNLPKAGASDSRYAGPLTSVGGSRHTLNSRPVSESGLSNQSNLLSRSRVKQTVICVSCVFGQPGDAAAAADINQADDELPGVRWGRGGGGVAFKVTQIRCER